MDLAKSEVFLKIAQSSKIKIRVEVLTVTGAMCKICSKATKKTVFINFRQIVLVFSNIVLGFPFLILNK